MNFIEQILSRASDPYELLLPLAAANGFVYEHFFEMDKEQSIFNSEEFYPYIARRNLPDYCKIAGLTRNEILEFLHLGRLSQRLKRPVRIGDIGCGAGLPYVSLKLHA